jgi:hypothetical protein
MHYLKNNPIAESHSQIFLSYKAVICSLRNAFSKATLWTTGTATASLSGTASGIWSCFVKGQQGVSLLIAGRFLDNLRRLVPAGIGG